MDLHGPVEPVLFKHWSFFRYHNYTLGFLLLHFSVVAKNVNSCMECTDAVDVFVTLDIAPLRRLWRYFHIDVILYFGYSGGTDVPLAAFKRMLSCTRSKWCKNSDWGTIQAHHFYECMYLQDLGWCQMSVCSECHGSGRSNNADDVDIQVCSGISK